jgi:hypothetical protein
VFGGEVAHEGDGIVDVFVREQFVVERAAHDAFVVDDVRDASIESDDGPKNAISFGDAFVGVTDHGKLDVQGLGKVALRAVFVRGHADDFATESDDFLVCVAKPRRFDRSPRGECFGEKVEHDDFAAKFGKADLLPRRRESIECGSWLSNADHRGQA